MIPKKLHYVWFGGKSIPVEYQNYIDNWAKIMPDWEIIRWDETNFDIHCSVYCHQAFNAKRWAFVSDYVRVKILFEHGGIYLDTDEEMVQSLDRFIEHKAFFGLEAGPRLQAGVFGCEPKNEIIGAILDYYNKLNYIENGKQNNTVIGTHFINVMRQLVPSLEIKEQKVELVDGVFIYPSQFFCPDLSTLKINENSYTIHRPMGSWLSPKDQHKKNLYVFITKTKLLNWLYQKIKR